VKVLAPSASSAVPIGAELLEVGLRRRYPNAEFFVSATRPPSVYRGNPFVVEVGLAYGDPTMVPDEPADVMRFANRVPLQYQPKACAISESVYDTNWRNYGLTQPKGSLPHGSLAICVHLASVWVPFTSEAKEAVAHYEELLREMKLAVQECGRRLGSFLRAREKAQSEHKRLGIFQKYIPEVATALGALLGLDHKPIQASFQAALTNFVRIAAAEEPAEEEGLPRVPSMPPPPDDAERPISEAPKALASKTVVTKSEPGAKSAKSAKAEKPAKATEPSPKAPAAKAPAPKAPAAKAPKSKTTKTAAKAPPAPKKPAKKSAPKKKGAR